MKRNRKHEYDLSEQLPQEVIDSFREHIKNGWSNEIFVNKMRGQHDARRFLYNHFPEFKELYDGNKQKVRHFKPTK